MEKSLTEAMALTGLGYIVTTLVCIALAWWGLQQFRFDLFLKQPKSAQGKLLQIMLSIVLGYQAARFVIEYFAWSGMLKGML